MPFPDRHIRPEHYPTIIGIPPLRETLKKPHCGLRRRNTILRETTMSATHATTTGTGITPGFPTSTNTGVPAGTPMKSVPGQVSSGPGWAWNTAGGYLEVSGNGADLSGLKVNGNIDISADNVTINHVKINAGGDGSMGISLRHTTGTTIENSNINGLNTGAGRLMVGIKDIYGDAAATTVENNNITKTSTDVQIYAG